MELKLRNNIIEVVQRKIEKKDRMKGTMYFMFKGQ